MDHRKVLVLALVVGGFGCTTVPGVDAPAAYRIELDSTYLRQEREASRAIDSVLRTEEVARGRDTIYKLIPTFWIAEGQELLARLGYGIRISGQEDAATRDAATRFERRHGLPVSGSVRAPTFRVAAAVVRRELAIADMPHAPHHLLLSQWSNYVWAAGVWFPMKHSWQASSISCERRSDTCVETYSWEFEGELKSESVHYDITRWDDTTLEARADNGLCTRYEVKIHRATEVVTQVESNFGANVVCNADGKRAGWDSHLPVLRRLRSGREVVDSIKNAVRLRYMVLPRAITSVLEMPPGRNPHE